MGYKAMSYGKLCGSLLFHLISFRVLILSEFFFCLFSHSILLIRWSLLWSFVNCLIMLPFFAFVPVHFLYVLGLVSGKFFVFCWLCILKTVFHLCILSVYNKKHSVKKKSNVLYRIDFGKIFELQILNQNQTEIR